MLGAWGDSMTVSAKDVKSPQDAYSTRNAYAPQVVVSPQDADSPQNVEPAQNVDSPQGVDAAKLFQRVSATLELVGWPAFSYYDGETVIERLVYLEDGLDDGIDEGPANDINDPRVYEPTFAMEEQDALNAPGQSSAPDPSGTPESLGTPDSLDACFPLGVDHATYLIKEHLRECLAEAAWQVQLTVQNNRNVWRLVDCRAFSDGGGDRLDADYPYGPDELDVICEAISVLAKPTG